MISNSGVFFKTACDGAEVSGCATARPLLSLLFLAFFLLVAAFNSNASNVAAAGHNDAYTGKVLSKIVSKWNPPSQLKGSYRLNLRVSLDDQGRILECRTNRTSGLDALDASACAAAKAAAPFGTPPYGLPTDIYISFWNGHPTGEQPGAMAADNKPGANIATQADNGKTANERAKALALEAAKKTGKTVNIESGAAAKSSSASYVSKATWEIRNAMYIPEKTAPGTYYATARLSINRQGDILSSSIVKSSGDKLLDKYVLQGIKRAGKISPPPSDIGDTLDLTFKLVRK